MNSTMRLHLSNLLVRNHSRRIRSCSPISTISSTGRRRTSRRGRGCSGGKLPTNVFPLETNHTPDSNRSLSSGGRPPQSTLLSRQTIPATPFSIPKFGASSSLHMLTKFTGSLFPRKSTASPAIELANTPFLSLIQR